MARAHPTLLEVSSAHPEPRRIGQAVAHLQAGRVVVYPTDTLYALAADSENRGAIDRLYQLRRLGPNKPLSLICSDLSQVGQYAKMSDECHRFMRRVLPGPYTFILSATKKAPRMGQDKRRAVGIRVPGHPVARALVDALGRPLLSTSTRPPDGEVGDPREIAGRFSTRDVALVLDSGLAATDPSTVIDWSGDAPEVVREGAGSIEDL